MEEGNDDVVVENADGPDDGSEGPNDVANESEGTQRMRMRKAQKAMNQRSSGKLSAGLVAVSTAIIQKAITQDILCTSDTIKRTDVEWCFKLQ